MLLKKIQIFKIETTTFSVGSSELSKAIPNLVTDASKPHTSWRRTSLCWFRKDAKTGTVGQGWKAQSCLLGSKSLLYWLWAKRDIYNPTEACEKVVNSWGKRQTVQGNFAVFRWLESKQTKIKAIKNKNKTEKKGKDTYLLQYAIIRVRPEGTDMILCMFFPTGAGSLKLLIVTYNKKYIFLVINGYQRCKVKHHRYNEHCVCYICKLLSE